LIRAAFSRIIKARSLTRSRNAKYAANHASHACRCMPIESVCQTNAAHAPMRDGALLGRIRKV
jgi:hypothetical protein